jgi:hypothetical protein
VHRPTGRLVVVVVLQLGGDLQPLDVAAAQVDPFVKANFETRISHFRIQGLSHQAPFKWVETRRLSSAMGKLDSSCTPPHLQAQVRRALFIVESLIQRELEDFQDCVQGHGDGLARGELVQVRGGALGAHERAGQRAAAVHCLVLVLHVVALQVEFERQTLKPVFHLIGFRLWV